MRNNMPVGQVNAHLPKNEFVMRVDVRIGIIKLTCGDRKGRTISLITHASTHGRAIEWCVEQSTPSRPPKENYSQQDTHAREQQ
jgi:hypothetical protein